MSMIVENRIVCNEKSDVCKLFIEQTYVTGKGSSTKINRRITYTYIIPIELVDEVKQYEWAVVESYGITPVISPKNLEELKKELGIKKSKKIELISLNHITPFVRETKAGRYYISSKNDMSRMDNDKNLYITSYKDKAIDLFIEQIEKIQNIL